MKYILQHILKDIKKLFGVGSKEPEQVLWIMFMDVNFATSLPAYMRSYSQIHGALMSKEDIHWFDVRTLSG